jgi:hypothetical protein
VVGKNYAAPAKSSLFAHDWSPIPEEAFKVSPARSVAMEYVTRHTFLRKEKLETESKI